MNATGKLITSINAGYEMAKKTIIDSNITTIIGAIFLAIFGSGPIKGFCHKL
jgi:preprotein translocase subunit SecD